MVYFFQEIQNFHLLFQMYLLGIVLVFFFLFFSFFSFHFSNKTIIKLKLLIAHLSLVMNAISNQFVHFVKKKLFAFQTHKLHPNILITMLIDVENINKLVLLQQVYFSIFQKKKLKIHNFIIRMSFISILWPMLRQWFKLYLV